VIVARLVEELFVVPVHFNVVFACSDLEVRNPSQLTINVSLLTAQW
jgi:hypothetical protein